MNMASRKVGVALLALFSAIILAGFVSASLEIREQTISSMAIPELNLPAKFNLEIKNLGDSDTFTIYSLSGIDIAPNQSFSIASGETKQVSISAMPTFSLKASPQYFSFEYKIEGQKTGMQSDELAISIVKLKDAFNFYIDGISPESDRAVIHFENKGGHAFSKVKLAVSSAFFSENLEFQMNAYEEKKIEIQLDKEKMKQLLAGPYIVNADITVDDVTSTSSAVMSFNEKPEIATTDSSSGILLRSREIEKKNNGNTKTEVTISISKDLFSNLFTSLNIGPSQRELSGFGVNYIFKKELSPNESLKVVVKTNWWILIGIVIVLIIIYYFIDEYIRNKVIIRKRISFVRTKGGEFALKVSIAVRARDFVEKIKLLDRLPPMVKVFERYGVIAPDRIDERNRRLEWDISALSRGEIREVSYIIYSKIGVVGKFELPAAEAIYEYKGRIKDAESNRAFYENEPREKKEE